MSASFEPVPPPSPVPLCPQCSSPVAMADMRCTSCGYALAGIDGRPGPYGPAWGIWAGLALALAYVVALAIILLGR